MIDRRTAEALISRSGHLASQLLASGLQIFLTLAREVEIYCVAFSLLIRL
jgi:hypothetical protein